MHRNLLQLTGLVGLPNPVCDLSRKKTRSATVCQKSEKMRENGGKFGKIVEKSIKMVKMVKMGKNGAKWGKTEGKW